MKKDHIFIKARKSQLQWYREVRLYTQVDDSKFVLYKPAGITLGEMRLNRGLHPDLLFINSEDKLKGLQEAQVAFNIMLEADIKADNTEKIKETLITIVNETLLEPRSGSLEGVSDTVNILISDYAKENDIITKLIEISTTDYTTVLHSINVMTFSLAFALYQNYSRSNTKTLGLASLLHDVGKTKIPFSILSAPRKLTEKEFDIMKKHTNIGYQILKQCKFGIDEISIVARDHHERIDGSGYPNGNKNVSKECQIVGLIDCYEALTNDDRPYRNAISGFDIFDKILKHEAINGKFDLDLCTLFIKSLGSIK